jgi:DNA polymerase-3 subunit gamma/tau
MSYLVLARKFRPKTFAEMVGQGHVVQALENALTTQRLHHAYLFTGTRGVGKTTVSRILAKSLNCQGPDGQGGITATPCGVCQACRDIDSGRFVDYTELDAASNRGVDEVQSLLEQAVYKPVQGRFKVFMIDEVHMLTNTAFNAMLKTLEEPPEYLKFVLATTDPQKVPVTVLSRCLQFNLRPMAPETVLEHLTSVLHTEQVPAEPQALRLLARAARGSMRDALSLTDQAIAFGNGELVEAGVRQMLGSVDRGHVFRLIEALAQGDGKTVVETSEALRVDGMSAASTLEEMTAVLQAMAVLQAVPSRAESADSATDPDAADTARLAALMPADETQLLYSLCLHGRGELGLAPDEYAALTMVLLRLLAFKPSNAAASTASTEKKTLNEAAAPVPVRPAPPAQAAPAPVAAAKPPVEAPVARTPALAAPVSPAPVAPAPPAPMAAPVPAGQRLAVVDEPRHADPRAPAPTDAPAKVVGVPIRVQPPPGARDEPSADRPRGTFTPIPASEDGDFWFTTVTQLVAAEAITALARELALQSQLVGRDTDQWLLRIERETLNQPSSREKLTAALAGIGHEVKLAIEIGGVVDSPARRNKQASDERQRVAEEAILSDPEVQALMRDFDAKIVPGSLKPV